MAEIIEGEVERVGVPALFADEFALHLRLRRLKLLLLLLRLRPVVLQEGEAVRQQPVVMLPAEQRFHAELLQCQHQPDALAQERAQRPVQDEPADDGNNEGRCQHPAIGVWRAGDASEAIAEASDHAESRQPARRHSAYWRQHPGLHVEGRCAVVVGNLPCGRLSGEG